MADDRRRGFTRLDAEPRAGVTGRAVGAMHAGQLRVDASTVHALLRDQFPRWAREPVVPVAGSGTVNAIFRVGEEHVARFPLVVDDPDATAAVIETEATAARELADTTHVPTSLTMAVGRPGHGYPGPWSVTTWLDGEPATPTGLKASRDFALDIAALLTELRAAPTRGRVFSGLGRGGSLPDHDEWMRLCLDESSDLLDVPRLAAAWAVLRDLPRRAPDVMSHKDLVPANLLVADGHLAGVLDSGGFGPAGPALDLVVAWHVFDEPARTMLRHAVQPFPDDLTWARGAAWAFEQALGLVWYYRESNPAMSALGRSTLDRIMASDVVPW